MLHSQASHAHLDPSTTLQASPSHDLSTERCWKTLVKLIEALQVRVRLIGREWEVVTRLIDLFRILIADFV
jgi:hypothetical protein